MKVSIIVPVYNVEKYIEKCIDSLINQTLKDIEIILIDDGSTDRSGLLCDQLAKQDNRIKVIHKENSGVSSARNLGLDNAEGEYVGFVDPDDWCETDMFEQMYTLGSQSNADAIICGYYHENGNEKSIEIPKMKGVISSKHALYQCIKGIGHGYFTSVWNKLIKRKAIGNILFNEKYTISEDEMFIVELFPLLKDIFIVDKPLYHWIERESGALNSNENYYKKWVSAYEAKKQIVSIIDKNYQNLAKANIYATLFKAEWTLYYKGEIELRKRFSSMIKPYRNDFLVCNNYSLIKKVKYLILSTMMKANCSKELVNSVGNITTETIKSLKQRNK